MTVAVARPAGSSGRAISCARPIPVAAPSRLSNNTHVLRTHSVVSGLESRHAPPHPLRPGRAPPRPRRPGPGRGTPGPEGAHLPRPGDQVPEGKTDAPVSRHPELSDRLPHRPPAGRQLLPGHARALDRRGPGG